MTRTDHLLTKLAEECCEVGQRATKAFACGLEERWSRDDGSISDTNAERIMHEYADLVAVIEMLHDEKALPYIEDFRQLVEAHKKQVERFLLYSDECGRLDNA